MPELAALMPKAFLHRNRGLLAALLVLLLGGISVAAAMAVHYSQLPAPELADRRGIVRWLIETRLRDQPQDVQMRLLARVEQELLAGIDLRDAIVQLDPAHRELLAANVDWLANCWFHREAAAYFATPDAGRAAMLDRQLQRIRDLRIFEQLEVIEAGAASHADAAVAGVNGRNGSAAQNSAAAPSGKPATASTGAKPAASGVPPRTVARVERWIRESDAAERGRLETYFMTLRGRMLWNSFQKWFS
jgi:hypothetical protein